MSAVNRLAFGCLLLASLGLCFAAAPGTLLELGDVETS